MPRFFMRIKRISSCILIINENKLKVLTRPFLIDYDVMLLLKHRHSAIMLMGS